MKIDRLIAGSDANRGYSGIPTFLRSKICENLDAINASYAVLGVPYDEGSPFVGGSRFCARAVREHSLRFGGGAIYDIENNKEYLRDAISNNAITDLGDIDITPSRADVTMDKLTTVIKKIIYQGILPIVLGGDHTITYPVVRGFNKPLHIVQFDAHMDYSKIEEGMTYTNSTSFRLLHELDHVKSLSQVGIRSMRDQKSDVNDALNNGSRIIKMSEIRDKGAENIWKHMPNGEDCYVTIDIDAYDMSLVPGCVSAEPNGFYFDELKKALESLNDKMNIVGFDFVEVNPKLDVGTNVTSYLGALTVAMFLGFIDEKRRLKLS